MAEQHSGTEERAHSDSKSRVRVCEFTGVYIEWSMCWSGVL